MNLLAFLVLLAGIGACQYQLRRLRRDIDRLRQHEPEPERGVPQRTASELVSESIDAHEARFHRR